MNVTLRLFTVFILLLGVNSANSEDRAAPPSKAQSSSMHAPLEISVPEYSRAGVFTVEWSAAASDTGEFADASYLIYRKTEAQDEFILIGSTMAARYEEAGLRSGRYQYKVVKCQPNCDESSESAIIEFNPEAPAPPPNMKKHRLTMDTDSPLRNTATEAHKYTWPKVKNATYYRVESFDDETDDWTLLKNLANPGLSVPDSLRFRVKSCNESGCGESTSYLNSYETTSEYGPISCPEFPFCVYESQ